MVVALKNTDAIGLEESKELINAVYSQLGKYHFDDYRGTVYSKDKDDRY